MGMSLSTATTRYLAERVARGELAPRTRRSAYHVLSRFAAMIGDPDISTVRRRHVERWQEQLAVSNRTRRNYFVVVRSLFRYAAEHGWLTVDPFTGMRPPKYRRAVPRQLTRSEVAALYDAAHDSRERLCLTLMVQLGLRCCEVAGLEWEDIDPNERTVLIRGKGGHERVLPFVDEAWKSLEDYHLDVRVFRSGPVVRSLTDDRAGIKAETLSTVVSRIFERSGVRRSAWDGKSAHSLRHQAAGDTLRRGAHLRDVQAMLGHQSLATTQTYLPLLVGDLRTAMEGRRYGVADTTPAT